MFTDNNKNIKIQQELKINEFYTSNWQLQLNSQHQFLAMIIFHK